MEEQPDGLIHHTPSLLDEEESHTETEDAKEQAPLQSSNELKATNQALRERLQQIGADRRRCLAQQQRCNELKADLQHTLTAATYQQEQAVADFASAVAELRALESTLAGSQQWNVTASDCFFIACEHGTVASINGLRLGAESSSAVVSSSSTDCDSTISTPPLSINTPISFFAFGTTAAAAPEGAWHKIPWREINAALGQVALLLSILEQSLSVYDKHVFRYELQCLGSTSKIGLRKPTGITAFYNLYYTEEAFQFFAKRNFNTAVTMLLDCVQEAATAVQERNRTIVLPYDINNSKRANAGTVSGLSVAFFAGTANTETPQHAAEWTRAMKYLLTDIKHIMVFSGVGLWTSGTKRM